MNKKTMRILLCAVMVAVMISFSAAPAFAAGDVAGAIEQTWNTAKTQIQTVVDNVVFPVIDMRRVCAYLINYRGINKDVVYAFAHRGMIYESADYHNAVFVGCDVHGVPRHAHKRGSGQTSSYKGNVDSSLPEYSFHWKGTNDRLYLFEAPIDMLSFISLHTEHWKTHSYAAACGVSDQVLWRMMKDNPKIQKVYLCLDNDEPGQTAAKRISDKLFTKGVQHEILVPIHKDWNEDLVYPTEEESEEEGETECQALQP